MLRFMLYAFMAFIASIVLVFYVVTPSDAEIESKKPSDNDVVTRTVDRTRWAVRDPDSIQINSLSVADIYKYDKVGCIEFKTRTETDSMVTHTAVLVAKQNATMYYFDDYYFWIAYCENTDKTENVKDFTSLGREMLDKQKG